MYQKSVLSAGVGVDFFEQADFFRVLEMAQQDLTVIYYRAGAEVARAENVGAGFAEKSERGFDRVRVSSVLGGSLAFVTRLGNEVRYDTPPTGAITIVQATAITQAAVLVGVTAVLLAAASAARKSIRVFNAGAADVYLGSSGVTMVNGAVRLKSGDIWIEDDAAAAGWYGISGTAGQDVRVQEVV